MEQILDVNFMSMLPGLRETTENMSLLEQEVNILRVQFRERYRPNLVRLLRDFVYIFF